MKAAFYTLGCKVNQYESEYMAQLLKNAGFETVSPNEEADYYIINSCTVTATADKKTAQSVRKFKRTHPNSTVILTGCMPQAFPQKAKELFEADIVISNKDDGEILSFINEYNAKKERIVCINSHENGDKFDKCEINQFAGRIRAFIKIEDGCNRFCNYCIIPKSRGRVRSKSPDELKTEIEALAKSGIKEAVIVGINLSAYGMGEDFDIGDAVEICANTPGIERVRLGSLEPDHITDSLIERLAKVKKLCPQFHLSLQSGSNKTLKAMNRHYTAEEYKNICKKLRSTFKDASITTDVMVGFCGESEEDFNESVQFVKEIAFEKVHIFPYSERSGTAASKIGDDIPKHEKERRAAVLAREAEKIRSEYMKSLIGCEKEVLFEAVDENNIYRGYTSDYFPVRMKSDKDLVGKVMTVKITGCQDSEFCIAE